jgi:hypothetical protein
MDSQQHGCPNGDNHVSLIGCLNGNAVSNDHRKALVLECWKKWAEAFRSSGYGVDALLTAACLELLGATNRLQLESLKRRLQELRTAEALKLPAEVEDDIRPRLSDSSVWEAVEANLNKKNQFKHFFEKPLQPLKKLIRTAVTSCFPELSGITIVLSNSVNHHAWLVYRYVETAPRSNGQAKQPSAAADRCISFDTFREEEEPVPTYHHCREEIDGDRGYRYLLFMFKKGTFSRFWTFDLSFRRWEELVADRDREQTVNMSGRIFGSIRALLSKDTFRDFRRLLVVTPDQLRRPQARAVLEWIANREQSWKLEFRSKTIETRLLVYSDKVVQHELLSDMERWNDFALFLGGDQDVALIEPALRNPEDHEDHESVRFALDYNPEVIRPREQTFNKWWERKETKTLAVALEELLHSPNP